MQISLKLEVLKVFTFEFSLSSDKKENDKKEKKDEVEGIQPTVSSNSKPS